MTDQGTGIHSRHAVEGTPARSGALGVVGIGASAGGLRALQKFFPMVPADTGLAYVVVMHLAPDRESHLADLLQPHATIPVAQVTQDVPLESNRIYVIPPGRNLTAVDSHLRLTPLEAERAHRTPVDHFFRTLAETYDGASVGVILSGTGTDGAGGIRHIHERGGLVVVQEPGEAEYDGMIRGAISTGLVDVIAPVSELLRPILNFIGTRPQLPVADDGHSSQERPDLLQNILAVVQLRTGHDFLRYKRSTVARRVARRMQVLGVEQLGKYLELLRESGREAAALLDDLLINVTSFFRDPEVFRTLEAEVIPKLFEGKGAADRIRVWSVGCSTGEEAYSLGMLLLEEAARRGGGPQVQVFASDLHERSLRQAREALYPDAIAADVPSERLERFFRREDGGYRIAKELRDTVVFAVHNLLQDPPFSRLDLIVCRNVLIYLQSSVQREVIELFHYALRGEGYLLLGTAETLDRSDLFRLERKESHLYRRRDVRRGELRLPAYPVVHAPLLPAAGGGGGGAPPRTEVPGYGAVHQRMVERYAPPSLLVDQEHNVVHLSERAGRYLQHPGGVPTNNVFKLVREELRIELRAALHALRERGRGHRSRPIPVTIEGESRQILLRVSPVADGTMEGFVLVIFDELDDTDALAAPGSGSHDPEARQVEAELEAELELARGQLQAVLEEFETSQEEMRASNEELQSANEELRSTMEELETSREELQSINEELQTLNQENKHKVEELSQLSNDLQNLLQATDVATLFLDRNLRILRYTPRVGEIFNVRHGDRGRPLADLTHRLDYSTLMDDARRVLLALVPVERQVETQNGDASYVVRVTPYRTMDDRIEGAVITLVDVTALKRSASALRESEERYRLIVESARDYAICTTDPEGRITSWSPGAEGVYGWTAAEAIGQPMAMFFVPEDREQGEPGRELAAARATGLAPDVGWHLRKDGTRVFIEGSLRVLSDDATGRLRGFLKVGQDVTHRRQTEEALRASAGRFRAVANLVPDLLWESAPDGTTIWYNDRWYAYTGQTPAEAMGFGWTTALHPGDRDASREAYERAVAEGGAFRQEYRIRGTDGQYRWFLARAEPMRDAAGSILRWFGAATDVQEQRLALEDVERRITERTEALAAANVALRRAAAGEAFRVALADGLRPMEDPSAIQMRAARMLGEHLRPSHVLYTEVKEDGTAVVHGAYADGLEDTAERYTLLTFGAPILPDLQAGRTVVIDDVAHDPRLDAAARASIGVGAQVLVPLVQSGRLTAILAVHQAAPRAWAVEDVVSIEEAAARTWDAVQRARAEAQRNTLRRQLASAEEDERRRLARELHDQLGQHLAAFALGLDDARRLMPADASAQRRLEQLEDLARAMPGTSRSSYDRRSSTTSVWRVRSRPMPGNGRSATGSRRR